MRARNWKMPEPIVYGEGADALVVQPSSGNVFFDLGFDGPEADVLLTASDLRHAIVRTAMEKNLSLAASARIGGVTTSRMRDLRRVKTFSRDVSTPEMASQTILEYARILARLRAYSVVSPDHPDYRYIPK